MHYIHRITHTEELEHLQLIDSILMYLCCRTKNVPAVWVTNKEVVTKNLLMEHPWRHPFNLLGTHESKKFMDSPKGPPKDSPKYWIRVGGTLEKHAKRLVFYIHPPIRLAQNLTWKRDRLYGGQWRISCVCTPLPPFGPYLWGNF